MERDENGHFIARPDSLGKARGIRIRKDLEPILTQLAADAGMSSTQWCRVQIEAAIAQATQTKANVKKSKAT